MQNTRSFCDLEGNEHALVPQLVEVRDNLGSLAVQVLAARENLADMDYQEMLLKFYEIISELHYAYEHCNLPL